MTEKVIGRCSICGGQVVQVLVWLGVGPPPEAYCKSCGAIRKSNLPTIPMESPNGRDRAGWDGGRERWEYKADKDTPRYDQYFRPMGTGGYYASW